MKNRTLKRLEALTLKERPKKIPFYLIDKGHITLMNSKQPNTCILCGTENYFSPCPQMLDDIDLHIFMETKQEAFALILDTHSDGSIDENPYSGFTPYPGLENDQIVFIYPPPTTQLNNSEE
jgi:hypothetical protein